VPPIVTTPPPRIDLHGFDRERARHAIGRLIDDAQLRGVLRVEIITGRGQGTLGGIVRKTLDEHRKVRNWGSLDAGEGCGVWAELRPASETGDGRKVQTEARDTRTPGQIARDLLAQAKKLS